MKFRNEIWTLCVLGNKRFQMSRISTGTMESLFTVSYAPDYGKIITKFADFPEDFLLFLEKKHKKKNNFMCMVNFFE